MRCTATTLAAAVGLCMLVAAAPMRAAALDVHVTDVYAPGAAVQTTIELHDIVPDRFRKMVDDGRDLHLRVQAELWESRPVWDRLVYPAIVRVFRLGRAPSSRDIAITDQAGGARTFPSLPDRLPIVVDLGDKGRLGGAEKYYVHVVATLGTLAEREVDELGDAVFGGDADTNSLASLGRMVFKTALKVSDYLQSVSAEAKSKKLAGATILSSPKP